MGSTVVNFWRSLTSTEQQAFNAVGRERSFARGATLMREGEQSNYVMVILGGWTQIAVRQNGGTRVIAERGPGQLVGERGALRVNVRSATVTALETVHALVMKTEDFASFIGAHPRVLGVVEGQIDDQLNDEQTRYEQVESVDWSFLHAATGHAAVQDPRRPRLVGENCTVLHTDVVAFGALDRSDRDRRIVRHGSLEAMRATLGLLWEECISEDRGDGLLIVVPPQVPTTKIMACLHKKLPDGLRLHNLTYSESARIQLRVAVNVGPVMSDPLGMSGEAIIRTARLIDAPAFKSAMAETRASLGIIVSMFVYETAIRNAEEFVDESEYEMIDVQVKESVTIARMRIF